MLKRILRVATIAFAAVASLALFAPAAHAQNRAAEADRRRGEGAVQFPARSGHDVAPAQHRPLEGAHDLARDSQGRFHFRRLGRRALVVARDPASGKWVGPAFYVLATGSVGFQAGISVSEGVTMVMTEKGFNSLLATTFKMGGDASVAAGPVGAGAKSDIIADMITFNRAKGVYGGLNFDGTVVTAADDWNQAYYGKKVLPPDILVRGGVSNKGADKLLAQVTAATSKR
jgi:hypothetical protein